MWRLEKRYCGVGKYYKILNLFTATIVVFRNNKTLWAPRYNINISRCITVENMEWFPMLKCQKPAGTGTRFQFQGSVTVLLVNKITKINMFLPGGVDRVKSQQNGKAVTESGWKLKQQSNK